MKVVTISREYGAGGHSIGTRVAKELGVEFYDRDIIKETAKAMGLDSDDVEKAEERISKTDSFLRAITPINFDYKDSIFDFERKFIIDLAKKGPCVILGRCAGQLLKTEDIECLNVFLYSDTLHKAQRIGELLNTKDINLIEKTMKKKDGARRTYFKYYTGKEFNECSNWDMALNTGALGFDTCFDLICAAARE